MESLKLERGGVCELAKGDGLAVDAAEESASSGEGCEQGLEAMDGQTALGDARSFLALCRGG